MVRTKLYLDSRRAKHQDQECAVRINITKDRKTAVIPADLVIAVKYWNPETSQVEGHPQSQMLNNVLSKRKIDVDSLILRLEDDGKATDMNATQIRDYVVEELARREEARTGKKKEVKPKPQKAPKPENNPKNLKRLFDAFGELHDRKSTREKYEATWKRIVKWYTELKKDATTLKADDVTLQWLEDFDKFLKKSSPSADARGIHFRNLKAVLNYAVKHDLIDRHPFNKFDIPKNKVQKKKNLGIEALRRIIFAQGLPEHLEKYRDFFTLSFMLRGLNTVDLCTLPKPVNGKIEWLRTKTSQPLTLTIEPEMQQLIDKYAGKTLLLEFAEGRNYRNFNNRLCPAMHKIREYINAHATDGFVIPDFTMYWARHTWASIANYLEIPIDTIGVGLGHSQKSITDLYIDRDPRKIEKANRKVLDYVLYMKDPTVEDK